MRHLRLNASPTGLIQSTQCRFCCTQLIKVVYTASFVSGRPMDAAYSLTSPMMRSFSSEAKRLGTSPALRIELMSSTKPSFTIWLSVKRKTTGLRSTPAIVKTFFRSSRNSALPYPRVSSIWKLLYSAMKADSRVRLCFPEPPSPTSIAFPLGERRIRASLEMCSIASMKKTRCMVLDEERLNSSRYESMSFGSLLLSRIGS
mmetsp:Transcript_60212/g.148103  ORF Transcript_60212/g.148103 Transcript_60212/m.148103 type:complete len:202 (-) Transcript_60212:801-1406(-)